MGKQQMTMGSNGNNENDPKSDPMMRRKVMMRRVVIGSAGALIAIGIAAVFLIQRSRTPVPAPVDSPQSQAAPEQIPGGKRTGTPGIAAAPVPMEDVKAVEPPRNACYSMTFRHA